MRDGDRMLIPCRGGPAGWRATTFPPPIELEQAMWDASTRGDRVWMDDHLAPTFSEIGWSGRSYDRADILDQVVGAIDAELDGMTVRPLGWFLEAHQGIAAINRPATT